MEAPLQVEKEPLTMDAVLPFIGEFGKFQILLEIAFCIMIFPGAMLILIPYFAQHNPAWECVQNSTVCKLNGTFDAHNKEYRARCSMPRSAWQFTKPKDYSIITQFDLYCDTEAYSHLATSLFFLSWAVGAIVMGWTSDRAEAISQNAHYLETVYFLALAFIYFIRFVYGKRYGRKMTLLPSVAAVILFGFISSFSPNLAFYLVARTLVGFFTPGGAVQMFVLISEYVGPNWRPFAGIMLWFSYALSAVVMGVIAMFVQTWKILMITSTAPYFIVFVFFKFIPESTRWLHVNGRSDEAIEKFRKIARFNGRELPEIKLIKVKQSCSPGLGHYLHLFKPRKIAIRTLIQGYAWVVSGLVFFGVSFGADDLGGNMHRDFILASLVEFPASILTIYLCKKIGRKKTVLAPMLISGISCIAVSLVPSKYGNNKSNLIALRVLFGMLGKFCITMSFNAFYTWSTEIYPTVIRGAAMGFLDIAARIGSALAPWVAKWLIVFHFVLPFSLMGASAVICAVLLFWLPETAGRKTPETLEDQFEIEQEKIMDKRNGNEDLKQIV